MCLVSVVVRVYCSRLLGVVWSEKESPSLKKMSREMGTWYISIFSFILGENCDIYI